MTQPKGIWKKTLILLIGGGLAFWATSIAISLLPIAAEYRVARWSAQTVWVGSLPAGLIIGFLVSFSLLRFFDRIPTKNPILKSVVLSFSAIVIIEVLSTFSNLSNACVFLVINTVMNMPRILALGITIGYLYDRLNGVCTKKNANICAEY